MERQDYIDQINDLKASNRRLMDMIDTLKQTLDSVTASNKRNEELVIKLTAQIDQLQKMVKNLEDKNQRHNKHTFGKSSLKNNKRAEDKKSREEEKEDYDGNHDNRAQASENTDNQIDYLYLVESEIFTNDQVTPEIIKKRRECKDVTDTLTTLYSHARKALRQKGKRYSDLMVQALNYMLNGWDELQTYRKDGRYTIDNLPAERAIRPFTVSRKRSTFGRLLLKGRKNSLHYSSEEGVEMAMTFLTIIETAKMWGLQVKEYLAYVWREVMSGNTNYESMTPEVVIAKQNS